jgi:hypothetical protein
MLLVGKLNGKGPLGRLRHRWMDNIKMDLGEIGWHGVDWIGLAQDRVHVEGCYESDNEPSSSIKYREVLEWLHNWRPLE